MIEVKKATVKDALDVVLTRQKAWDATYRGIYPDEAIDGFDLKWHITAEEHRLLNPDFLCYLVLDGQEPIGYVSYGIVRPGTWKDFCFRLHSLYLLPPYQKIGLGKKLFQMAQQACMTMGYTKMYLDCHPKNQNALDFYRHMGGTVANVDSGHQNPQEDSCTIEYIF